MILYIYITTLTLYYHFINIEATRNKIINKNNNNKILEWILFSIAKNEKKVTSIYALFALFKLKCF